MTKKYLVVFEHGKTSFGAFAPDIPGCIAVGESLDETRQLFLEAAKSHLALIAEDDESVPEPTTTSIDFAEEHHDGNDLSYYVVEWLPIVVPVASSQAVSA